MIAFRRLCVRLLRCVDAELFNLPEQWLDVLLSVVQEPARQLTLLRRSAGLPFAITGIFMSCMCACVCFFF